MKFRPWRNTFIMSLILVICCVLCACTPEKEVVPNITTNAKVGKEALIEIGSYLWYDQTTGIVYWWNGKIRETAYSATTPTPYYAPNGLPYKYNSETNTFEEIGE